MGDLMTSQAPFKGKICCIGAGYVGGPTMAMVSSPFFPLLLHPATLACYARVTWRHGCMTTVAYMLPGLELTCQLANSVVLIFWLADGTQERPACHRCRSEQGGARQSI